MDPKDQDPTDSPGTDPGSLPPSSETPPAALDEASITDLIKRQVAALVKAQPKADPAPGAGTVDVEAKIKAAIAAAMAERDKEDQVFVLQQQFDELKASLKNATPRRGWGAYLLGPGLSR